MNDRMTEFFEAHVAHELGSFKNGGYKKTIEDEISAIFQWIKNVKFKDIITPEQITGLIKRNVVESPVAGGITELTGEMSRKVLESVHNKDTLLEDIFARKQFDDIVDKGAALEDARNYLIKKFLNSTAYSKLISNVLYIGIREYLLTENMIARKMPALSSLTNIGKKAVHVGEKLPLVSSLIKVGKGSVNHVMPSLEADIEKRVKRYIEKTIDKKIEHSEKFLIGLFTEKHILAIGEKIWESIAKTPLSEYFSTIDSNDMEDFILIEYDFWLHFRKTRYFEEIYKELVSHFFDKYGENELDVIIEDLGVTEEMVKNEIIEVIRPGIETALDIGYLEERIRARLSSFYLSEKAQALFS